jgi:hypothetical protein
MPLVLQSHQSLRCISNFKRSDGLLEEEDLSGEESSYFNAAPDPGMSEKIDELIF